MRTYLHLLLIGLPFLTTVGCAGPRPGVQVIGISTPSVIQDEEALLFVEVTNPTQRDLELSRFDYELEASGWPADSGEVPLSRGLAAGATAVVEIPIKTGTGTAASGQAFEIRGRLHATENRVPFSWPFNSSGALDNSQIDTSSLRVKVFPARAR